jgi:adenine-specific DNA-methyltransferase
VPASVALASRRYLGNKTKLTGFILDAVRTRLGREGRMLDLFAGTGAVASAFHAAGWRTVANDLLPSNVACLSAWLGPLPVRRALLAETVERLDADPGTAGGDLFAAYADAYFDAEGATRLGRIRQAIDEEAARLRLNARERDVLLASLIYAADKAAQTFGHFEAFRKNDRAPEPLRLRMPSLPERPTEGNLVLAEDANVLAPWLDADVAYLDPPYNSRQYGAAYHVLDAVARGHAGEVRGVTRKPARPTWTPSRYCQKDAPEAFRDLVRSLRTRWIAVSYSNMGEKGDPRSNARISDEQIRQALDARGPTEAISTGHRAFTTGLRRLEGHQELLYLCRTS